MELLEHVNLKTLNTFHIPALTRYFTAVTQINELKEALAFAQAKKLPFLLLGQGSNVLFRRDYPGLVIELNIRGKTVTDSNEEAVCIQAACGENWHDFVMYCLDKGYHGLENLSLIPGTVGAAPVQNIGAYGVEVAERILSLEALDVQTGATHIFRHSDCEFGYRTSIFKKALRDRFIITQVTFRLSRNPVTTLNYGALTQALAHLSAAEITPRVVSEAVCQLRRSKLPDPEQLGNAGSFFWNPLVDAKHFMALREQYPDIVGYPEGDQVKIPAAWLIEKAGWKGHREGDVGVHKDHALVLVNHGTATGEELCRLAEDIQQSVLERFHISLHPEVRII